MRLSQVLKDEKISVLSFSQATSQKLGFGKIVCEPFNHLLITMFSKYLTEFFMVDMLT